MLKIKQVAERLNVSLATAYSLTESKKLKHVRISSGRGRGTIRVDEADLEAFVEGTAVQPNTSAAPLPKPREIKLSHLRKRT